MKVEYKGSSFGPLFQSKGPSQPEQIEPEDLEIIQSPPTPVPEPLPSSPPAPGE